MPTNRRRHMITETEDMAGAIEAAAERWPDEAGSRARLLVRLVEMGHEALCRDRISRTERVARTSGVLTGAYGPAYLARLRDDWPE